MTWTQGAAATVGDAGVWWYSPWVTAKLSTAANQGDTLTLSVLAADCGLGGHGGYAYVDYFGADQPPSPPNSGGTPELGTFALMGISMLPMAGVAMRRRRRKA